MLCWKPWELPGNSIMCAITAMRSYACMRIITMIRRRYLVEYTKYVLKDSKELGDLLSGKDHFFVVACNKCFKEFNTTEEPEVGAFTDFANAHGEHITGTARIDFLPHRQRPGKAPAIPNPLNRQPPQAAPHYRAAFPLDKSVSTVYN